MVRFLILMVALRFIIKKSTIVIKVIIIIITKIPKKII